MRLSWPYVILALLTFAAPALAQDLGEGSYDVLILGGGKKAPKAKKVLDAFVEKVFYLKYGAGPNSYPTTLKSDDVGGLNPGFHIAVAGMCRHSEHDADERKRLLADLKALQKGAYVRTVKGAHGDPCPPSTAYGAATGKEAALRGAIEKNPKSVEALFAYAAFLESEVRFVEAEAFLNKVLELEPEHEAAQGLAEKIMVLRTF